MRFLQITAALVGGGALAQFPEFYQQYLQRLAGHMDELRQRAQEIANDAAAQGLDVQAYIARFLDSPAHALEGERMADALANATRLEAAYNALIQADVWRQLPLFVQHFDPTLARDTGGLFQPALPLGLAGATYALVGAAIGILVVAGGKKSLALTRRHTVKARGAKAQEAKTQGAKTQGEDP